MLREAFAAAVMLMAVFASIVLIPRAFPRRRGRRGQVIDRIIGARRVGLVADGEHLEVMTTRDLPLSIGDRVRLDRRPRLIGVTLIPMSVRRLADRPGAVAKPPGAGGQVEALSTGGNASR